MTQYDLCREQTTRTLEQDLEFALSLADTADRLALNRFESKSFSIQSKNDGTPVTDVDVKVEARLRQQLSWHRLDDAVLGEELGETTGQSGRRWVIDPIDGTANFISEDPQWAVQVALEVDGEVVLGVVSAPALQTRWWAAKGHGAFKNNAPIHVSRQTSLANATYSARSLKNAANARTLLQTRLHSASGASGSDLYWGELLVASGEVDIDVGGGGQPWDLIPRKAIVVEAGALFTATDGGPIVRGQAICASRELHEQLVRAPIDLNEGMVS